MLRCIVAAGVLILCAVAPTIAQTATYHLHQEASTTTGLLRAAPDPPDTSSLAIQSALFAGPGANEYTIKEFDTPSGVPGIAGAIPAGLTVAIGITSGLASADPHC